MKIRRRKTRVIRIGKVSIGGDYPVAIQSMAKTKTSDVRATVAQILRLAKAGCEIIRVAVKDHQDAQAIAALKKAIAIPLVADIHYHYRLAMTAIESGADKIRLNPGNIFRTEEVREIVACAKNAHIPIRVGLNSGSVMKNKQGSGSRPIASLMVHAALDYIKMMERFNFHDVVVSLKASSMLDTVEAYRHMAPRCRYPFHIGVTATGLPQEGLIKTSIATGALLLEGIGDTIRVSLTDKPEEEIKAARSILGALGLRRFGPEIISCPTCGRCEVDLIKIVKDLEKKLSSIGAGVLTVPLKVAVMGCVVNGPGEAKDADIGIAFGKGAGILFKGGKQIRKVSYDQCVAALLQEIERHG